jgi:predicted transcriptional regulator
MFELSNNDRFRIFHELSREATSVSTLSKELGLATQEVSRHLSRLGKVGLTRRDFDGLHQLSSHGELVLRLLPSLKFASQHGEYLNTHSLANIPEDLIMRMGDLEGATYVDDIMVGFYNVDKMVQRANEYIWTITDKYVMSSHSLMADALKRGVSVKNLEDTSFVPPQGPLDWEADTSVPVFVQARTDGILEERVIDGLDIYLFMSEKEVAALAFPLLEGGFDYVGFTSEDERPRSWCKDVFEFYWEKGLGREALADKLYRWVTKRPKAGRVLRSIGEGKGVIDEEWLGELENVGLVREGELTMLGHMAFLWIRRG